MNVLFHTTVAFGVAVLLTDTNRVRPNAIVKDSLITGLIAFAIGIILHGVLDYMPHCYPIDSKVDAILSFIIIAILIYLTNKRYRLITGLAFFGGIFPDLADHSQGILNKYFGLNFPIGDKFFPWHWQEYSGSIYNSNCGISTLNHILIILTVVGFCWVRRTDMKRMFNKNEKA